MYRNHLSDVGLIWIGISMHLGFQHISATGREMQCCVTVQCTGNETGWPGFAFQP